MTVPQLLDIPGLAEKLADSPRHIRRLVAEQRIPYIKVGHFVRFDPEEISEWLAACRRNPPTGRPAVESVTDPPTAARMH